MPLFPIRAPPEDETISRFVLDPRRDGEIGFTADALVVTGLRNELDGNRSLTFFAPTNEAWYSLLFRLGITKDELFLESSWLSDAMRYHIIVDDAHTTRVGLSASLATQTRRRVVARGNVHQRWTLGGVRSRGRLSRESKLESS